MYIQKAKFLASKIIWLGLIVIFIAHLNAANVQGEDNKTKTKGSKNEKRIINGQNITIDKFPYIVQISDRYSRTNKFLCGGTVISESHIVTAAHCVLDMNRDDLVVVANATYLDDKGIRRYVKGKHIHQNYNSDTRNNDVAVLTLAKPLPLGKFIKVAKLCKRSWQGKERVMVLGWGKTSVDVNEHSNQLQYVTLDGISNKECRQKHQNSSTITSSMSCTVVEKGKDGCQGDSGGPAFFNGTLCGVISFGYSCGLNGFPSVYVKIPKVRKFILNAMKK